LHEREGQLNKVNPRSNELMAKLLDARRALREQQKLDALDTTIIDNQALKDLSNQIFDLIEEEEKITSSINSVGKQHEQQLSAVGTEGSNIENLYENLASDQMKHLNRKFDLLIKRTRNNETTEMQTYASMRFKTINRKFNENVKAYVEICCQSPTMVRNDSYFGLFVLIS
jgi:hypothetical protein